MRINIVYKLLLILSLASVSTTTFAYDSEKIKKNISRSISIMKNLMLAKQVARLGIDNRDPLSLIVAYNIAKNSTPEKSEKLANLLSDKNESTSSMIKKENYMDVIFSKQSDIINQAKIYAEGKKDILAIIGDAIAEQARGAGEQVFTSTLAANSSNSYNITYTTNELAGIYIEETKNSGLMLSVIDENNKAVCNNNTVSESGFCSWEPTANGKVTITLNNISDHAVSYYMLTN